MTSFHGGKMRIGKQLATTIVQVSQDIATEEDFDIVGYCEPFCGMLGVYQHIPELIKHTKIKYKAGDLNKSIIKMWQATQKGWKPPSKCSETEYNKLKKSPKASPKKGFVGHQCSFGGQYFQGFSPKYDKSKNPNRARKRVIDIGKKVKNVKFTYGSYTQFSKLKNYIIYCDPPYPGTKQFYRTESGKKMEFNYNSFLKWCDKMSEYNIVFVSGYMHIPNSEVVYNTEVRARGQKTHKTTGRETLSLIK